MVAGGLSQAPAATERRKIFGMSKKIQEGLAKVRFRIDLFFCEAIVKASCLIVSSVLRVINVDIGHFSPHEYNTKETRTCLIV